MVHSLSVLVPTFSAVTFDILEQLPMQRNILALLVFVTVAVVARNYNSTGELVQRLTELYGVQKLNASLPCILRQGCHNCTANLGCVWVQGSDTTGLVIKSHNSSREIVRAFNVDFCWFGNVAGANKKGLDRFSTLRSKEDTFIQVTIPFTDFYWERCSRKTGGLLIFTAVLPAIITIFCTGLCLVGLCIISRSQ